MVQFTQVRAALADYEDELESKGLLPDQEQKRLRGTAILVVLAILGGLAAARIVQALSRGQTNLVFLLILVAVVGFIAYRISALRGTASGRQALASLETLTARVKRQVDRLRGGGATNEALLLAAVFGIYVLPESAFEFVYQLFPKPRPTSSGDSSWDSGSSCSSSSSGSSCGGGSGCGGCGGGGD